VGPLSAGYIDSIDYATGELTIETNGGVGAKVRLNGAQHCCARKQEHSAVVACLHLHVKGTLWCRRTRSAARELGPSAI
jgi:hypothetical protein